MADEPSPYTRQLEQALNAWREQINRSVLPELKETLRTYRAAFKGLLELLVRNTVVSEDPYAQDHKISDIKPPSNDPVSDNDRNHQVSGRLSFYDAMLDFLTNYYQISLDMLSIREIKKVADTVGFFKWQQVTGHNSSHTTTRALADMIVKLRGSLNTMESGILMENINQLVRAQNAITGGLKQLSSYKREEYKLFIRTELSDGQFSSDLSPAAVDNAMTDLKKRWRSLDVQEAFYTDLIREVIVEDYTPEGRAERDARLKKLLPSSTDTTKATKRKAQEKKVLLDAVHALSAAGRSLHECAERLNENSEELQAQKRGLIHALKRWLSSRVQGEKPHITYDVEYTDITTSAKQTETVDFTVFMEKTLKKARQLSRFSQRSGKAWSQLQEAEDDQVLAFLTRIIEELQLLHRTLAALDDFFRAHRERTPGTKSRGIRIELGSIRDHIRASNQLRHEFVARKEETEQLRKLGVPDV
ncbi:MAG: hypothetical protein ACLFNQ_09635 [Spirochaetaceae bacterium]